MSPEDLFIYAIPVALFAGATWLGNVLGKRREKAGLAAVAALCAGFCGLMFVGMEQARGLDGLGYVVGLIGIGAPATAGGLIGGLIGWARSIPQSAA